MTTTTMKVPAIHCGHCVRTIERELAELPEVRSVEGSADEKRVTVEWSEDPGAWERIVALLEEIGYPPEDPA